MGVGEGFALQLLYLFFNIFHWYALRSKVYDVITRLQEVSPGGCKPITDGRGYFLHSAVDSWDDHLLQRL